MKLDVKLFLALIAILLITSLGSAYATMWYFNQRIQTTAGGAQAASAGRPQEPEWDDKLVWSAGTFTVNLQTPGVMSYVRATMGLRANTRAAVEELERRRIQVSDRLITILRTTTKSELDTEEGISNLKRRIMDGVNEIMAERGARVTAVYFSELVMQ